MAQPVDANEKFGRAQLLDATGTALAPYLPNAAVWRCPADQYVDPNSKTVHARSYSMNSAVGTIWYGFYSSGLTLGDPVQGGWLPGASYNANQKDWLTYGKSSSFTRPGPSDTWVIMDENPFSINDGSFAVSAVAEEGKTYLIDFPTGAHGRAGGMTFADGHSIIHKWQDTRTFNPQGIVLPGQGSKSSSLQTPNDNEDCKFLAPLTSAHR